MAELDNTWRKYDHEHTNPWNKVMHAIGIPIILAGIILAAFTFWRTGWPFRGRLDPAVRWASNRRE